MERRLVGSLCSWHNLMWSREEEDSEPRIRGYFDMSVCDVYVWSQTLYCQGYPGFGHRFRIDLKRASEQQSHTEGSPVVKYHSRKPNHRQHQTGLVESMVDIVKVAAYSLLFC